MAEAYVKSTTQQGMVTLEFFHPQSNSLPGKILNELASAITHAEEYPDTVSSFFTNREL